VLRLFPEALLETLRRLFKDAMPNAGYGNRFDPDDPRTLWSLVIMLVIMLVIVFIIEAGGIQLVLRSLGYP
jgi:hypothetical protein